MKKILILLIIAMTSCTSSNKKIIFLGDSITEAGVYDTEVGIPYDGELIYPNYNGFITLLSRNVEENIELIGKGIGGDKVSDLLTRYRDDVIKLNPDKVFIYIGINDVWHKYDFGTGSDIDLYENGRMAVIQASSPELGNRPQQIRVEIPAGASQLITKLRTSNVDFDAHTNQTDNLGGTLKFLGNFVLPLGLLGFVFLLLL